MKKSFSVWSALALIAVATACAKSSPTQPTSPTQNSSAATSTTSSNGAVSTVEGGATITSPAVVSPSDNAQITFASQPITLTVRNAVTTGRGTLTYTFEVATDSGFSAIKQTKSGIAAGNGQTSVTLDKLAGATTYYWRARVQLGSSNGPNSPVRSFNVGPEVVLQAPVLATPGANGTVGDDPVLTVNNVQRSGPAGTIVYTFQVSRQSDFSSVDYTGTSTEQPNTAATSHQVTASLADKTTYWWRVQAADPSNAVTSPWSSANPFVVQLFDVRNAIFYDNQPGVANWPETAKITRVDTAGPYIVVDFDRRDGANRWADVGFGSGSLEYTLGACFNIDAQWYCSAAVQFWYGRELEAGGPVSQLAENWYYNPARWGRMSGHQPAPGEIVGFWVGQGNLRGGNGYTYQERSNVVLVPFGTLWTLSSQNRIRFTGSSNHGAPMLPLATPSAVKGLRK